MCKSQKNFFSISDQDLLHIQRHTEAECEKLRGKSLFITGGTGFFGKWLLAALCHLEATHQLGLRLTVLSRNPTPFLKRHPLLGGHPRLQFQQGHVADLPETENRYDYILHAASDNTAFTTFAEEKERSRTIVDGTRRILKLAGGNKAGRILYVSSGAVYGTAAGSLSGATEDDYTSAKPLTPYATAKREAEQLCEESGLDFVTARAFAFLGPHLPLDAHFAAGNFLRDAQQGGPILVRGDGTALRSYLYPADLIIWLLRILLRGKRGRAYNVGSDEVVSTAQLARHIAQTASPAVEVTIQSQQAQGPHNIYLPVIQRVRAELDLDVTISLQEAIARTWAFLQTRND